MKKFFLFLKNFFNPEKDVDNVLEYVEKMEKGEHLTAEEKARILKSAIKITKDQKSDQ